jgi:PhnB protein
MNTIHEVFPYLRIRNARQAIEFYERAFGAVELFRLEEPGGRIGHAQLRFGPSVVMLAEESPERGSLSPLALGGTSFLLHLHVDDVDEFTRRVVAAGATLIMEPTTQFYGERSSRVRDPFGHEWLLGSTVENVSTDEMQRRYTNLLSAKQ